MMRCSVLWLSFLTLVFCKIAQTQTPPLQFLPLGSTDGVSQLFLSTVDDDSSGLINAPGEGFPFGANTTNPIYVNSNGYFSFTQEVSYPTPRQFPYLNRDYLVAPFWTDIDIELQGNISYEVHTTGSVLADVNTFLTSHTSSAITGRWMLVGEWRGVQEHSRTGPGQPENTFQGVLVTNGTVSYAVFIYNCDLMGWGGGATIGYHSEGDFYMNHELTGLNDAPDIACTNEPNSPWSNVVYQLNNIIPVPDCGPLANIANGSVSLSGTTEGSTATYSCDPGRTLEGDSMRECQSNSEWSGSAPTCVPDCGPLANIANGNVIVSGITEGSTATYSCDPGHTLEGDSMRECQSNSEWSGSAPTCGAVCSELSDPANGKVNLTGMTEGSMATFTCDTGFSLVGSPILTCQANSQWSGNVPTCDPCNRVFQLKLGQVHDCHEWRDAETQKKHGDIKNDILARMTTECQCSLSITDEEFRCVEDAPNTVLYRAVLASSTETECTSVMAHMKEWVESGSASVVVARNRLVVDSDCTLEISSLTSNDECTSSGEGNGNGSGVEEKREESNGDDPPWFIIGGVVVGTLLIVTVVMGAVTWCLIRRRCTKAGGANIDLQHNDHNIVIPNAREHGDRRESDLEHQSVRLQSVGECARI